MGRAAGLLALAWVGCGARAASVVAPAPPPPRVASPVARVAPLRDRLIAVATARTDPTRAAPVHDAEVDAIAQAAADSAGAAYVVSTESVRRAMAARFGSGLDPYVLTARGDDAAVAAQLVPAIAELRGAAGIATIGVAEVTAGTGRVVAVIGLPPPQRPVAIDRVGPIARITVPWPWSAPPRAFDVTGATARGLVAEVHDQQVVLTIDCARAVSRTIELDAGPALVASVVNVCAPSRSVVPSGADLGPPARTPIEIEQRLFELINRERVAAGYAALAWDAAAQRLARRHAARMDALDFVGHVGPDGADLTTRVASADLGAIETFENVGLADGPGRAHLAFMASPGHRRNLLAARARRGAVGVVLSAREPGWFYVTEELFEPRR